MECEGKYYTFGTGGGGLISGRRLDLERVAQNAPVRSSAGCSENRRSLSDRLQCYRWWIRRRHAGRVLTMNNTLDPKSPDFALNLSKWLIHLMMKIAMRLMPDYCSTQRTDGSGCPTATISDSFALWNSDPKTGKRVEGNKENQRCHRLRSYHFDVSRRLVLPAGQYGNCCDGPNSTLIL